MAYKIMVQGTASDAGKSIIATAICRHFYKRGLKVAPFKAQNMTLNTYVTQAGAEIGGSQAVQALAAGAIPRAEMNPVLIKPKGDMSCHVIALGQEAGDFSARAYRQDFLPRARSIVAEALRVLNREYDLVVLEGAGSPVEVNLKAGDIVNMAAAKQAESPVILVADIDRGGVFASLVGTCALLEPDERRRIVGIIINKFRGDPQLFTDGIKFIQQRLAIPVLGVLPFLPDLAIPAEDSLALDRTEWEAHQPLTIHVLKLPLLSNFTDLDPLMRAGVRIELVTRPQQLTGARGIIIPGSENPVAALNWLRKQGLDQAICKAAQKAWILGIAGGYQMLGTELSDPTGRRRGLGLLPVKTELNGDRIVRRLRGEFLPEPLAGEEAAGYQVQQGVSVSDSLPLIRLDNGQLEGAVSADCRLMGTYLHGIMENRAFCRWWLEQIAGSAGLLSPEADGSNQSVAQAADRLEEAFAAYIDTEKLWELIRTWQERP